MTSVLIYDNSQQCCSYHEILGEWDSCCVECPGKFQNRERGDWIL